LLYLYLSSQTNNSLPKFSLLLPPSKKQVEYFNFLDKSSAKCVVNLDERLLMQSDKCTSNAIKGKVFCCCEKLFVIPIF